MVFTHLFSKHKKRNKEPQRRSTTDIDTSGILAQPFLPMMSRAKSPCDLLDWVGYPRYPTVVDSLPPQPPQSQLGFIQNQRHYLQQQYQVPLTVRNKTPSPAPSASAAVTTTTTEINVQDQQQQQTNTTDPPTHDSNTFHMPTPKKAMPPTWRILNAGQNEKTLVEKETSDHRDDVSHEAATQLQQQVVDFQRERQAWARREEQCRQLEQEMIRTIQRNQAEIDRLSQQDRPPLHRSSIGSYLSYSRSTPSYIHDDDDDDDDEVDDEEVEDDHVAAVVEDDSLLDQSSVYYNEKEHTHSYRSQRGTMDPPKRYTMPQGRPTIPYVPIHPQRRPLQQQKYEDYYDHNINDDDDGNDEGNDYEDINVGIQQSKSMNDGYCCYRPRYRHPSSQLLRQSSSSLSDYYDTDEHDIEDDWIPCQQRPPSPVLLATRRYQQYPRIYRHPAPPHPPVQAVYPALPYQSTSFQYYSRPSSTRSLQDRTINSLRRHRSFGDDPSYLYYH